MKEFKSQIEQMFAVESTLEGVKKLYRKLAMKYHPDKFEGDGTEFIIIQEIFEYRHKQIEISGADSENAWKHKESASQFMDIINKIIKYNIDIEIIGSWIYVKGTETRAIKDEVLKPLKFWWSKKHLAWIYSGQQGKTQRRATKINPRDIYGSEIVKTQKLLAY